MKWNTKDGGGLLKPRPSVLATISYSANLRPTSETAIRLKHKYLKPLVKLMIMC